MEGADLRIIIIGLLASTFVAFGCPSFLHGEGLHVAMAHHFFHVNLFHLAVNGLSVWLLFKHDRTYKMTDLIAAYCCGTVSWFLATSDPAGFSNFIFALIGLRTPSLKDRWWRQSSVAVFLAVTLAMAIIPHVSAITHIVSFILGCLCASARRIFRTISHDYHRATYHR